MGSRIEALREHLEISHPGTKLLRVERERHMIYDARGLANQVLNKKITMERARILGDSLFAAWASPSELIISVG
jgi:hypothetical protein